MQNSGYRDILRHHLVERIESNPRYSMRAFSRDLKISPSRLSEILNGKQGLSEKWARKISTQLQLNPTETESFCAKVLATDGRAKETREKAALKLQADKKQQEYQQLDFDTFKIISDWYHYAIIELTQVKRFQSSPAWIAKRLGISEYEAKLAVERLLKLELLKSNKGRLTGTGKSLTTTNGIPSEAIRNFNKQILTKAKAAISTQDITERDISTLTVAVRKKDLPIIMEKLKTFRRELNTYLSDSVQNDGDEVYSLALQFFRLSEKETK
jgi:uncharacterized protein (TIGR02147 family)